MKKIIIPFMILFCFITATQAQEKHPNSKVQFAYTHSNSIYGEKEIDSLVIRALAENMPNYYHSPNLPQFAVIGKNRKFYFGVGGYVKTTLSYDWGNPISSSTCFTTADIPMSVSKGNHQLLQFSAQTSNISFNFVGLPGSKHQIGAYLNFNFINPNYAPYVTAAYVNYAGFTVGYGFSLFTDAGAAPPTIDYEGPNALTAVYNAVFDYQYQWGKHWGVGIGLENPMTSYTNGIKTRTLNQKVPDIPFYIQASWNERSSWVRLSGLIRNMMYYDEVKDKSYDNVGWGVKLSGSIVFCPQITMYYQGLFGEGISNYIQDMNGLGLDMLPSVDHSGKLDNVQAWGAYLGLQYNFIPSAFISATYSIARTDNNKAMYTDSQYKGAQYVVANIMWNINAQIQIGAEYLWGQKEIANGERAHDNRVQAMLMFNF